MIKNVSKSARKIVPILGINVDSTRYARVLELSLNYARSGEKRLVVTPNPEIILQAQGDSQLAGILNRADLAPPDGIGLVWAMRFLSGESSEVVPGRVLFEDLVREAAKRRMRVFLLGGKPGVTEAAAKRLAASYQLPVTSYQFDSGPWLNEAGQPVDARQRKVEQETIRKINQFKPHFFFVGFGPPKQEKWLAKNLPKIRVGLAMTVGGAFDYLAGKVPAPPQRLTDSGFEWLWRLLTQPWRLPRIINAVIIFPLRVFCYRLTH